MAKTLTSIGIEKIGRRYAESIDHATYTLDGEPKTIPPFKSVISENAVKIYVYFDDTISGEISGVQLVDVDGDVVSQTDRTFTKPLSKGLYVAFNYDIREMEVETNEGI